MGSKKKKGGMAFNNLELATETKEQFITLCAQYEYMGNLFKLQGKALVHPMFSKTTVPEVQKRILQQYQEMGEALKNIGTCLDLMPGKNVLKPEGDPRKSQLEKDMELGRTHEGEDPIENKTFVSNISPDDLEAEKNGYQLPEEDK